MNELKDPSHYLPMLIKLRSENKYAKNWNLEIETHTNRHNDLNGYPWGWYSLSPLGIELGFWSKDRDDLKEIDIREWNKEAKEISKGTNSV